MSSHDNKSQDTTNNNISWNSRIETSVKEIGEKSKGYKIMHIQSARKISMKYNLLMYSGIILGPLAGFLSGIGAILHPPEGPIEFPIAATCAGFLAGIVVAISKFGKFEEKSSHHKLAASKYTSLESNVRRQLVLCRTDRINAGQYLDYVGSSFDELFMASPLIARKIYKEYVKVARHHGLIVPDEYGLTIKVDERYQKNKLEEMKNVSAINVNDTDNTYSPEQVRLTIKPQPKEISHIDQPIQSPLSSKNNNAITPDSIKAKRPSLEEETFKGTTEMKRTKTVTHFLELNKFSDGRMEYEMKRMMGLK